MKEFGSQKLFIDKMKAFQKCIIDKMAAIRTFTFFQAYVP